MTTTAGLTKIAEGREAEIYAWEDGAVLRLLRNPNARQQAEWEAVAMRAAATACSVPAVRELITVEGRPGIVMDHVDGIDLLTMLAKQPWKVWMAGRISGELQAQMHRAVAPGELPSLKDGLRNSIATSPLVPDELRAPAVNALAALPEGERICHGDYHPGNIIMDGERPVVIDWTAVRRGEPGADVQRSLLMLRLGEPPPTTPWLLRQLIKVGRGIVVGAYLGAYRRHGDIDMRQVDRWELPVAVNRLHENIVEERARLLARIERLLATEERNS
jgi:aminoglycoside phosphotransferase (APT) family kinase protein